MKHPKTMEDMKNIGLGISTINRQTSEDIIELVKTHYI